MTRGYHTSIDLAGLALGAGSLMLGCMTFLLLVLGDAHDPRSLALGFALGTLIGALGLVAIAGPLWLALHAAGLRGPVTAGVAGAVLALTLFVAAQTHGFGLFDGQPLGRSAALFRWVSALLTAGLLAMIAAAMALAMWRIAYRRR